MTSLVGKRTCMIECVSAVIIVKNGEATIEETLASLHAFKEVILYDNGSDDKTLEIASQYENVKVVEGEFLGFGPTKQAAVNAASNDWILSLDADEMASKELTGYLLNWDSGQDTNTVIKVRRDNYLMGEWVKYAGWGSDWLVRMFHRERHNFNDNAVHETVALHADSCIKKIPHPIAHNAVQHLGQFLVKVDRYTEFNRQGGKTYPLPIIMLKTFWRFFESYLIKGGFLAGWRGLAISWSNANGVFYKYMKVYADRYR